MASSGHNVLAGITRNVMTTIPRHSRFPNGHLAWRAAVPRALPRTCLQEHRISKSLIRPSLFTAKDSPMRRTSKIQSRTRRSPRLVSYRPVVELLEDRLQPGDLFLGHG